MRLFAALMLATLHTAASADTVTLAGRAIAIFNLAGTIEVTAGTTDQATADIELAGPDAGQLQVDSVTTRIDGESVTALVIRYPQRNVVYKGEGGTGRWGQAEVRVAQDGTFHGSRGDRVRIRSSGPGLEAHANIVLRMPAGNRLRAYQAVGRITAHDLAGDLYLDTHSGGIEVAQVAGDVEADTGSGSITIDGLQGRAVSADTGSGAVSLAEVTAERVVADTGSGAVRMRGVSAKEVVADTGSGSVDVDYTGDGGRLVIDTGSGSVRVTIPPYLGVDLDLRTGSGGIQPRLDGLEVRDRERDEFSGGRGDRSLDLRIDTGSGSITVDEQAPSQ